MKYKWLSITSVLAFALAGSGGVLAQPGITVVGAPPWDNFVVTNSDRVLFEFVRDPTLPFPDSDTVIPMTLPGPTQDATFTFTKDGAACPAGNAAACSGSDVSHPDNLNVSGSIQIINLGEAAATSTFTALVEINVVGNWLVSPTTNAEIQSIHVIPDVVVSAPAQVPSAAVGVSLDASASHSVFEPAASAPAITSFSWSQTAGPAVILTTSGAFGELAQFDAPVVAADTDLIFEVEVGDGTFTAAEQITVTVSPPALPVDAVLAVDTSGSMGWHRSGSANDLVGGCCSRLSSAKLAARQFVERLGTLAPDSRVGVAIFPGEPTPSAVLGRQFTPAVGLAGVGDFPGIINDIGAENVVCGTCAMIPGAPGAPTGIPVNWNGTPTRCGLDEARNMLVAASAAGTRTRVIVLLSDGAWNSCPDPADAAYLAGLVADDIRIYSLGMGTGSDNVNHASLQAISVGTGLGTAMDPIGFNTFEFGDPASEPNLVPFFEKIMTDMVSLDFATDPAATIRPQEVRFHRFWVVEHDSTVSVTVSWESSRPRLLSLHLVGPAGQTVQPQVFGNGYVNATLVGVGNDPDAIGEWTLVVRYPEGIGVVDPQILTHAVRTGEIAYNYGVVVDSQLTMDIVLDRDRYFTGDAMVLEARLSEANRRLAGAEVTARVRRPQTGIGQWHLANQVSPGELRQVLDGVDTFSGEPLSQLDRKNFVLLQQRGVEVPPTVADPVLELNDAGRDGDRQAGDGIYTGRYAGFLVPGVYRFSIAASGTTESGNPFTREAEIHRFVEIALDPGHLAGSISFSRAVSTAFFPEALLELLRQDPPRGFERRFAVLRPEDTLGNPWGPGQASKISFSSPDANLLGEVVDNLDGAYVQAIEFRSGTRPTVEVTVDGTAPFDAPIDDETDGKQGLKGVPGWVWLLLILLLVVILVIYVRKQ